jgi:hypothetical protein
VEPRSPGRRHTTLTPESVPASERTEVEAVDLTTQVRVFAAYSTCTETPRVVRDEEEPVCRPTQSVPALT